MTDLVFPYPDFITGTTISSAQMDANNQAVADYLNTTGVDTYQAGTVTGAALASAVNAQVGVNDGTTVRRGKSIISTESTAYTSTSFGSLNVADEATSIVLPTDGLIRVWYTAQWRGTHATGSTIFGYAGIFLGSDQVKYELESVYPNLEQDILLRAGSSTTSTSRAILTSCSGGLYGLPATATAGFDSELATTGQVVGVFDGAQHSADLTGHGGCATIFAAAGTYTVGVKVKANTGCSLYLQNRKLWVEAVGF